MAYVKLSIISRRKVMKFEYQRSCVGFFWPKSHGSNGIGTLRY